MKDKPNEDANAKENKTEKEVAPHRKKLNQRNLEGQS